MSLSYLLFMTLSLLIAIGNYLDEKKFVELNLTILIQYLYGDIFKLY
jgi:hypothetical protein